jgi:hypothetical protein
MSEIKLLRQQLLTLIEKLHEAQQASKEEKPASPEDEESGEKDGAMIRSLEDQLDSVNHELQMAKIPALNISQIDDDFASSQGTSHAKTDESSKTSGSNPWSACLKESQESVVAMEIDKPENQVSHKRSMSDTKEHTSNHHEDKLMALDDDDTSGSQAANDMDCTASV